MFSTRQQSPPGSLASYLWPKSPPFHTVSPWWLFFTRAQMESESELQRTHVTQWAFGTEVSQTIPRRVREMGQRTGTWHFESWDNEKQRSLEPHDYYLIMLAIGRPSKIHVLVRSANFPLESQRYWQKCWLWQMASWHGWEDWSHLNGRKCDSLSD